MHCTLHYKLQDILKASMSIWVEREVPSFRHFIAAVTCKVLGQCTGKIAIMLASAGCCCSLYRT